MRASKRCRWGVGARCAWMLVIVAAVLLATGCAQAGSSAPKKAASALQDAAACADELAERYQRFAEAAGGDTETSKAAGDAADQATDDKDATDDATGAKTDAARSSEEASAQIEDGTKRLQADLEAIEQESGTWQGRDQAVVAIKNLQSMLSYERDILDAQKKAREAAANKTGMEAALATISALDEGYQAITAPACLANYLQRTIDVMPTIEAAAAYSVAAPASTLSQYSTTELVRWWMTKQSAYDAECDTIMVRQCTASGDVLRNLAEGKPAASKPDVSMHLIDEIAPNLYPSLDAVANLGITSPDDTHEVQVEVEVVGFSQPFAQKYGLAQGYNYLPIKPAVLPTKDLPDLSNNTTTQLNVKVTDAQSGEVLAQEAHPVDLLSLYDFRWSNDEFGQTASFDMLAWLRPQASEVQAVNRKAADVLGEWTGGAAQILPGYQGDPISTLLQVAAIQKAVSDSGVAYVADTYSFSSDQHVLTPNAVVQKRQGLCIETSVLMASCLMSAGMHPLIIITPGHAQVAVETYANSGCYFLIETTVLPYEGIDTSVASTQDPAFYRGLLASGQTGGKVVYWTLNGTSTEWDTYFKAVRNSKLEYGGIFVIDCNLQQVMGIQGLENL